MGKKEITVIITDKDGSVLLEYSEPIEISRGAMENMNWIKKGVWTIKKLLNINISQELDRAREEGARDVFTKDEWFMLKLATNDIHNKGNGAYDEIGKKIGRMLSKLTTK